PLAPGEHLLVVGGDGWREARLSFRVDAGVETVRELRLERCGVREVAFMLPADAESVKWIACPLVDDAGASVWNRRPDCTRTPPSVRVSAAPGTYRLVARADGGLAGELDVVLPARGATLPALALPLAAKR